MRLGLAENTLVVFASDNGGLIRPGRSLQGRPITVNDPLRGEKGTVYEGGIRVPLLVRWPGHVSAGAECTTPVTSEDLFPTFAAAAKAETPAAVTGLDLTPLLREQGGFEREALYWHYPHYHHMEPAGAIRRGDWKLVEHFEDGRLELFNLAKDLGETNDLSAQESQRTAEMRAALAAWREKISARMPSKNPKFDPNRAGEFGQR